VMTNAPCNSLTGRVNGAIVGPSVSAICDQKPFGVPLTSASAELLGLEAEGEQERESVCVRSSVRARMRHVLMPSAVPAAGPQRRAGVSERAITDAAASAAAAVEAGHALPAPARGRRPPRRSHGPHPAGLGQRARTTGAAVRGGAPPFVAAVDDGG
jgi:hypothetical protein